MDDGATGSEPTTGPEVFAPGLGGLLVPVADLREDPKNARSHDARSVAAIQRSLEQFGQQKPVVALRDGTVIAGNGTLRAARALGWSRLAVVRTDLDGARATAFAVADNRSAELSEWNVPNLADALRGMADSGIAVADLDLDGKTIDAITRINTEEKAAEIQSKVGAVTFPKDSVVVKRKPKPKPDPTADADDDDDDDDDPNPSEREGRLVASPITLPEQLNPDPVFESDLPWQVPELREDMIFGEPIVGLKPWLDDTRTKDDGVSWYLRLWKDTAGWKAPLERTIIGFYMEDSRFERLWSKPDLYIGQMRGAGVRYAICPNCSVYWDQPRAVHLYQVYRSRWLGRYLQEVGIQVIPDVSWTDEESLDYCLIGIPLGTPYVSVEVQCVSSSSKAVKEAEAEGLKEIVRRLQPGRVLLYGTPLDLPDLGAPTSWVHTRSHAMKNALRLRGPSRFY